MSRQPLSRRAPWPALRLAFACLVFTASADAQDIRAIQDSLAAMRERVADARQQLANAEFRVRALPNDSLELSGAKVLFNSADVPPAERRRLAKAFARAERELVRDLGDDGRSLLAETRWQIIVSQRPGMFERPYVSLVPLYRRTAGASASPSAVLRFPIAQGSVSYLVKRGAGERLVIRHASLNNWLGGSLYLRDPADTYYAASRELALRGNGKSRRCVRGDIAECAIILDPARRDEWYEGESENRRMPPASHAVRESVLHFVLERAGPSLLSTIAAAPDSAEPIALLAQAAGLSREELLRQWQLAISSGGTTRAQVAPRMALSSLLWIVLFGAVAVRRRPR
ncbi:MAG: hypothetical protein C0503_00750 [Gemmatimonas sp.]|nr:hypothetical protein [Gemmatimonas sp.]